MLTVRILSLILLTASSLSPIPQPKIPEVDSGFARKAYQHILHLASLGNRIAGTEGEVKAIEYVRKAMEEMGLTVCCCESSIRSLVSERSPHCFPCNR